MTVLKKNNTNRHSSKCTECVIHQHKRLMTYYIIPFVKCQERNKNMNAIVINSQSVLVKQYNGHRVLTFKDIDLVHGRPEGTARKRFNDNKKHFVEGEDYYNVQKSEKRTLTFDVPNRGLTVITESGYLMLVKSFTDDLSWEVQRQLVKSYFRGKEEKPVGKQLELYEYFDKSYNGEPVLSVADVSYITGLNRATVNWFIRAKLTIDFDYYLLSKSALAKFKDENPKVSRIISCMYVITKSGFDAICKAYGIKLETPKLFIEEKKEETSQAYPLQFTTPQLKEEMADLRKAAERLIHLTYLLDNEPGTIICGQTYHEFRAAIIRQAKQISCFNL